MSKTYYGYIRVSTSEQGHGASLSEQRGAIAEYARQHELTVSEWFEETRTAAKAGRRQFSRMLAQLKQGKADGVIIHKIDRSARNLGDWARIGELVDQGTEVRFAHDNLDITTRGGRLTADIQAVIAADFIRNNREEVKKGIYGWLKRGYYPFNAPLGYENRGRHKFKEIDPVVGPLVALAFELYATGRYSIDTLRVALAEKGLARAGGRPLLKNSLAKLLRNAFYIGLIRIERTGDVFEGGHAPLIPKRLFDKVQTVLDGRVYARPERHDFRFRRLIRCATCPRTLTGERQKGHIYYRCHTCPGVSLREAEIDGQVEAVLDLLRFDDGEMRDIRDVARELVRGDKDQEGRRLATLDRDLAHVAERLERLTDALLDGDLDKQAFNERKARLLADRKRLTEARTEDAPPQFWSGVLKRFESWNTAQQGYSAAIDAEKREELISLGSNFTTQGKELQISMYFPFAEAVAWRLGHDGAERRTFVRMDNAFCTCRPKSRAEIEAFLRALPKFDLETR